MIVYVAIMGGEPIANCAAMPQKRVQTAKFLSEAHLVRALRKHLPQKMSGKLNQKWIRTQVHVGTIIPDLVQILSRERDLRAKPLRQVSYFDCVVLAEVVHAKRATIQQLVESVYARTSTVSRTIGKLRRLGLISEQRSKGTYTASFKHGAKVLVSVEAKLLRWREAIKQAKSYLAFSNLSYVAMPDYLLASNRMILKACRENGVGLIAVGPSHSTILEQPRIRRMQTATHLWLLARYIGLG